MLCYIGPGGGLSAIGVFAALAAALLLAVFGFVWYPLRKLLRTLRGRSSMQDRSSSAGGSGA